MENDGSETAGQQIAGSVNGKNEVQPAQEINLVKSLEPFIKYVRWENRDADYFLKTVRGNNIMTEENENAAMSNMLQSFIDNQPLVDKLYCLILKSSTFKCNHIDHLCTHLYRLEYH